MKKTAGTMKVEGIGREEGPKKDDFKNAGSTLSAGVDTALMKMTYPCDERIFKRAVQTEVLPKFDLKAGLASSHDVITFEVSYDTYNHGHWEEISNGARIWRLRILSADALSLSIFFKKFSLTAGNHVYIYNDGKSHICGGVDGFTQANCSALATFNVPYIPGAAATIEFVVKPGMTIGSMVIGKVVHTFREKKSEEALAGTFGHTISAGDLQAGWAELDALLNGAKKSPPQQRQQHEQPLGTAPKMAPPKRPGQQSPNTAAAATLPPPPVDDAPPPPPPAEDTPPPPVAETPATPAQTPAPAPAAASGVLKVQVSSTPGVGASICPRCASSATTFRKNQKVYMCLACLHNFPAACPFCSSTETAFRVATSSFVCLFCLEQFSVDEDVSKRYNQNVMKVNDNGELTPSISVSVRSLSTSSTPTPAPLLSPTSPSAASAPPPTLSPSSSLTNLSSASAGQRPSGRAPRRPTQADLIQKKYGVAKPPGFQAPLRPPTALNSDNPQNAIALDDDEMQELNELRRLAAAAYKTPASAPAAATTPATATAAVSSPPPALAPPPASMPPALPSDEPPPPPLPSDEPPPPPLPSDEPPPPPPSESAPLLPPPSASPTPATPTSKVKLGAADFEDLDNLIASIGGPPAPSHPKTSTTTTTIAAAAAPSSYAIKDPPYRHVKARSEHPDYPARFAVPDDRVYFSIAYAEYQPVEFTHPVVLASDETIKKGGWADPPDASKIANLQARMTHIQNGFIIDSSSGRPLNPFGRTGMSGRGLLGKFGPNHAADPIVTRVHNGKHQMVAVKRKDTGAWAIPGGMVDAGEQVSVTLRREFEEEAGNVGPDDAGVFRQNVDVLFKNGTTIFQGYVDDPRNTDNAWMETVAVHFQCSKELGDRLKLHAGDDAADVKWLDIDDNHPDFFNLYASHRDFIKLCNLPPVDNAPPPPLPTDEPPPPPPAEEDLPPPPPPPSSASDVPSVQNGDGTDALSDDALPDGWVRQVDAERGLRYYGHEATATAVWIKSEIFDLEAKWKAQSL